MLALGQHAAHGNGDGVREVYEHRRRDLRIEHDRRFLYQRPASEDWGSSLLSGAIRDDDDDEFAGDEESGEHWRRVENAAAAAVVAAGAAAENGRRGGEGGRAGA